MKEAENHLKWFKFEVGLQLIRFLLNCFKSRVPEPFFLQIGANDGRTDDPIFQYAEQGKWSGITIEPVERIYAKLIKNYINCPNVACVNAACGKRASVLPFYEIDASFSNQGISSFKKSVIQGHFGSEEEFERNVSIKYVNVVTVDEILNSRGVSRIDLIAVDVEGMEFDVLQGLSIEKYHPTIILIEHYHTEAPFRAAINQRMHDLGYDRFVAAMETAYVKKSLFTFEEAQALDCFRSYAMSWMWSDNHFDA